MGNRKREKQNLKSLLYRESVIEYGTKRTRVRNLRKPGRMPSSPKGGESDITIANAESSGKRRKLARARQSRVNICNGFASYSNG